MVKILKQENRSINVKGAGVSLSQVINGMGYEKDIPGCPDAQSVTGIWKYTNGASTSKD